MTKLEKRILEIKQETRLQTLKEAIDVVEEMRMPITPALDEKSTAWFNEALSQVIKKLEEMKGG